MTQQLKAYKSIRKPMPPSGRVIRPKKGGGYQRNNKHRGNDDSYGTYNFVHPAS